MFVLVHLVVLGLEGWLASRGWNGGLPPISLLAAVAAVVPLLAKRRRVRDLGKSLKADSDGGAD